VKVSGGRDYQKNLDKLSVNKMSPGFPKPLWLVHEALLEENELVAQLTPGVTGLLAGSWMKSELAR